VEKKSLLNENSIRWHKNRQLPPMYDGKINHSPKQSKATSQRSGFSCFELCKNSWWVLVFCFGSVALYYNGFQKKSKGCHDLQNKIRQLELERKSCAALQDDLKLQISSQSDPAWIELTLMNQLGVVPEGQMKVYFKKEQ
jgi:hypothetical protein